MRTSRRTFLGGAAATAGTSLVVGPAVSARREGSANDAVRVGVIGCNGMGSSDMASMLKTDGVECAALCDVDSSVREERAARFEEGTGRRPDLYGDYRQLLDDSSIDAVIIGTPDHWHCRMMVDACDAGKDVYCEKPLANSIDEVHAMVRAAKRTQRVVQVGQWQRSGKHWTDAMEFLWTGKLGAVRQVKVWAYMPWDPPMKAPDSEPPAGVDYDMWLGPAKKRPFNENRFHWNFRWYWDYAGGLMTDWGVHLIDVVLWGMKAEGPNRVFSAGGNNAYPDGAMETPDSQQAIYEFDDFTMIWEHALGIGLGPFKRQHGVAFVGNNGTLLVDRAGWQVFPEELKVDRRTVGYRMTPFPPKSAVSGARGLDQHTANFVECMRTREQPVCNAEVGSAAAINAHLGNVALRTGEYLEWSQEKGEFVGSAAAKKYFRPEYHNGWKLPTG